MVSMCSLRVLPVSFIKAVIAVIPFDHHNIARQNVRHFVVGTPGLDAGVLSGPLAQPEPDSKTSVTNNDI